MTTPVKGKVRGREGEERKGRKKTEVVSFPISELLARGTDLFYLSFFPGLFPRVIDRFEVPSLRTHVTQVVPRRFLTVSLQKDRSSLSSDCVTSQGSFRASRLHDGHSTMISVK